MASNVTFQSRNVLSKKVMVKKEVFFSEVIVFRNSTPSIELIIDFKLFRTESISYYDINADESYEFC